MTKGLIGGKHHPNPQTSTQLRTYGMSSEFLCREVKLSGKQRLIDGIAEFWETIDVPKCHKYIRHLKKVVPKVIDFEGGPTGYYAYDIVLIFVIICIVILLSSFLL